MKRPVALVQLRFRCYTDPMKKKWSLIFKGRIEDFDPSVLLDYWRDKSPTEKFRETSSLIENALKRKGKKYEDVSRLLRLTAVLKRPPG